MNRLSPFVGRVAELAALEESLASAVLGRGGAVVLSGEPGIGKTRLASELCDRAERRGARVLWARCATDAQAPAYWPFAQLLSPLHGSRSDADLVAEFGPGASDALSLLGRGTERPLDPGQAGERFRLFEAVTTMLVAAADTRPVVLVFDDIHAADPGCLQLLVHLVRSLRSSRLLVVATMRAAEARRADVAPILTGSLAREAVVLSVDGWTRDEVGVYLAQSRSRTGPSPGTDMIDAVHRASAGNPFFIGEIAALLKPADADEHFPVPAHVREAVLARLEVLAPAAGEALRAAAVAGLSFDTHIVASLLGTNDDDVSQSLGAAVEAGFLERGSGSSWSFRHEIARDVLYEEQEAAKRRAAHIRCAEALARSPRSSDAVAHHLLAALPDGDVEKAAGQALAASEAAAATLAYERAATWLGRGLDAIARHGEAIPELAKLHGKLLLALGDAAWAAGDLPASRASYEEAATIASSSSRMDSSLLALAALGVGGRQQRAHVQFDARVVELLERALAALPAGEPPFRARLQARLAYALYAAPGSRTTRERLCGEALATARASDDADTLRWVLGDCRWALWGPDTLEERRAIGEELFAIAQRGGDREAALVEQGWRLVDALEAGDRTALDQAFAAYRGGAAELRLPWFQWYATRFACLVAQIEGRVDDAERLAAEAMAAGERAGHPDAALAFGSQMLGVRLAQERAAEIEAAVEHSIAQYPDVLLWRRMLARVRIAQGRDAEAGAEIDRARSGPLVEAPGDFLHLASLALLAEVTTAAGDDDVRRRVFEALEPYSGRQVVLGFGMAFLGPVDQYLGELASACGDTALARAKLEAAAAQASRLGAARWAARSRVALRQLASVREAPPPRREALADSKVTAAKTGAALLQPDGAGWRGEFGGEAFRLGPLRGVVYLRALLADPDREIHVLELASLAENGNGGASGGAAISDRADRGDAGPMLDDQAKRSYRRRLAELKAELDEATDFADTGRIAIARAEIEALEDELARAVGLGGRDRRSGAAAERARVAVAKRIRSALERIGEQNAALQRYLEGTIRTGTFCVYRPDPGRPVDWKL